MRDELTEKWGRVDGVLHSIGFAPAACLGDDFMGATWDDVAVAVHVSAYSLKVLAESFVPLMTGGGAFVGLDFDNRQAWPAYNWMGVAKSALQSVNRYLAKELGPQGIRCNLIAAGPVKTMAAKSIPGFALFEDVWDERAPLGWDVTSSDPVAALVRRPAQRLVPGHDRRDHPRRRRLPRHGCLTSIVRSWTEFTTWGACTDSAPVAIEADEPVFHEPWEGRTFALMIATAAPLACARGRSVPASRRSTRLTYLASSYYERWARSVEAGLDRAPARSPPPRSTPAPLPATHRREHADDTNPDLRTRAGRGARQAPPSRAATTCRCASPSATESP